MVAGPPQAADCPGRHDLTGLRAMNASEARTSKFRTTIVRAQLGGKRTGVATAGCTR